MGVLAAEEAKAEDGEGNGGGKDLEAGVPEDEVKTGPAKVAGVGWNRVLRAVTFRPGGTELGGNVRRGIGHGGNGHT